MSRIGLAAILSFQAAEAGPTADTPAEAAQTEVDPEAHIEAGEEALVQGRPDEAAEQFGQAYAQLDDEQRTGDLGALLVGEVVKARLAAWRGTTKIDHLVTARDMLRNHGVLVEEAGGDASEFLDQMLQIDGMITRAREASPKPPSPVEAEPLAPEHDATPKLPSQRNGYVGGLAVAGVGAASLLVGAIVGAVYGLRGREFSENLARDNAAFAGSGCTPDDVSTECRQLASDIEHWRVYGRKANNSAILGSVLPGALGVIALCTGLAVAFTTDPERRYRASAGGLEIRF